MNETLISWLLLVAVSPSLSLTASLLFLPSPLLFPHLCEPPQPPRSSRQPAQPPISSSRSLHARTKPIRSSLVEAAPLHPPTKQQHLLHFRAPPPAVTAVCTTTKAHRGVLTLLCTTTTSNTYHLIPLFLLPHCKPLKFTLSNLPSI